MNKIFKRIVSSVASLALGVSALASSFTMTASAAGQINREYTMIQDDYPLTSGSYDIWRLQLGHHIGNYRYDEQFDVFCIEHNVRSVRGGGYYKVGSNGWGTWRIPDMGRKRLISEICYYGYNNNKDMANYVATQALVWEVAANSRNTETFALTGTSLRSAAAAYGSAAASAYDRIANNVLKFRSTPKASAGTHTLAWNGTNYACTIAKSDVGTNAPNEINDFKSKVTSQGLIVSESGSNYVVSSSTYFSGTKTVNYNRQFAQPFSYDEFQKTYSQTVCIGNGADPRRTSISFTAQQPTGDITVVKKSANSQGVEDATLAASVKAAARFMVLDVAAQRYIKTSIDTQGNYVYRSSDGYSDTSTDPGTIFKLNNSGEFKVTNLPIGKTYRIIEIATAAHYEIPKATIEVTLDESNKSQTKQQINKHTNSLYISKRIIAQSDDKNHINGKELAGASMAIVAEDGTTFATWTSDGKEHIVYDVPAGKYTLKELAAPDGYQIATDISFEVDENNKVTATGATVESKDDIPLIVMFDEVTRTDISKVDATTGKELAGAKLTLYDEKNNKVDEWTSTTKPHKVYGLVVGKKYTLIEDLAPLGYAKTTDVNFTVEGVDKNGKAIVTKVKMEDEVAKGSVEGIKVDEHDKPLENAVFGLFKADCKEFAEANAIMTAVSDKDGKFGFEKIPYGKYIVTELVSLDGYVFSDKKYDVDIRKDKQIIKLKAVNEEITLNISKKDVYGKELKGAKMQLIDKDGKVVDEWTSDGTVHVVKCLKAGKYILKEIASPDGYVIATDIEFEIDKYNKVTVKDVKALATDDKGVPTIVMVDDTTKVKISKQDMTTGKELPGAKLQVLDENGKVVEEWTSTNKPHYIEAKLTAGKKYTLREVIAPNGYEKATDISFTVDEKGTATQVVMKDELKPNTPPTPPTPPDNPPQTGYVGNSLPIGILLGAVVMCVVAMIFARKKDEK